MSKLSRDGMLVGVGIGIRDVVEGVVLEVVVPQVTRENRVDSDRVVMYEEWMQSQIQ